jgi:DegV family protein with EDD domain
MIEAFIAMRAAEAARDGASLDEVETAARDAAGKVDMLSTFRTLEFLRKGGRIGAAKAFLGSALKLNPFIKLKNGHVAPAGATTTRRAAISRLIRFAETYEEIELLAVEHTECPDEAAELVDSLSKLCNRDRIFVSTMTPVIGTHTGPGLLLVGVMGKRVV